MFGVIDRWVEKKLKKRLHAKKKKMIDAALGQFRTLHPGVSIEGLEEKLSHQIDLAFSTADSSILKERIKQSKYTFWLTIFASIILVGALGGFSMGSALPFVAPIVTALVSWGINIGTLPLSYACQVQGVLDAAVKEFEQSLEQEQVEETAGITGHANMVAQLMKLLEKKVKKGELVIQLVSSEKYTDHREQVVEPVTGAPTVSTSHAALFGLPGSSNDKPDPASSGPSYTPSQIAVY